MIWDCSAPLARIATLPFMSIVAGLFSSSFPGRRSRAVLQEAGILGIQLDPRGHCIRGRDRFLDSWKAGVLLDLVPDRPGTDPENHVGVRLADLDGLVVVEGLAGEDRRTLDQEVAVPGEAEAGPDEQLMAVGRDDLVHRATELHAVQGIPAASSVQIAAASASAVSTSAEMPGPRRRGLGEGLDLAEGRYRVFADLGDAVVLPADDGPVGLDCLQDDRAVVPAFDLREDLEWYGKRVELPVAARRDVLDGQVVVPILRP